jgi:hypothetical protein
MKFALVSFVLFSVALAVPSSQHVARDPQRGPVRPPGNTCSSGDCQPVSFSLVILYLHLLTQLDLRASFHPRVASVAKTLDGSIRPKGLGDVSCSRLYAIL